MNAGLHEYSENNTNNVPMVVFSNDSAKQQRIKDEVEKTPRYDISIFNTPFSKLPDPKRVWIGEPGSELEGLGIFSSCSQLFKHDPKISSRDKLPY